MYMSVSTFMHAHTHTRIVRIAFERVTQRGGERQGTFWYLIPLVHHVCEGGNSTGNEKCDVESRRGMRGNVRRRLEKGIGRRGRRGERERKREKEEKG